MAGHAEPVARDPGGGGTPLFSPPTKPWIYLHPAPSFFARCQDHCLYQKQKKPPALSQLRTKTSV